MTNIGSNNQTTNQEGGNKYKSYQYMVSECQDIINQMQKDYLLSKEKYGDRDFVRQKDYHIQFFTDFLNKTFSLIEYLQTETIKNKSHAIANKVLYEEHNQFMIEILNDPELLEAYLKHMLDSLKKYKTAA